MENRITKNMDKKENKNLIKNSVNALNTIEAKLALVKYNCADDMGNINEAHLKVNQKKCAKCKEKTCTFICPAKVYSLDENSGEIIVQYENCLECGLCRIACKKEAIDWQYPVSGCGVVFKHN